MAKDISAVGAKVIFSGGLNTTITEFSDEGTPFECADVDLSTNAKNLNGEMISSRTPSVYSFSVTVIPGSEADDRLSAFFKKQSLQPGNATESQVTSGFYCNCTVYIPRGYSSSTALKSRSVSFTNCRPKSGPLGPSTSAEGRLSARTYTFEAEGVTI